MPESKFIFKKNYQNIPITVDPRCNEVGYNEQLDIVNNFWPFGGLSIEIMLKNSVYYELRYNEFLDIMNDFTPKFSLNGFIIALDIVNSTLYI